MVWFKTESSRQEMKMVGYRINVPVVWYISDMWYVIFFYKQAPS